jgi:nitrous oxidase accessory protein NosD
MSLETILREPIRHRYIYKKGIYNNYSKDIDVNKNPMEALRFIIMYLFDSNRYDVKINMHEEEPCIMVIKDGESIKIASFETNEGDIIMNIYPNPKKKIIQQNDVVIDENDRNYFISVFLNTVSDYTFNIEAYLNAPYLGRSMLEEELFKQEQQIDDEYEYEKRI